MPVCLTHKKKLTTTKEILEHSTPECVLYTSAHEMPENDEGGIGFVEGEFIEDIQARKEKKKREEKTL